MARRRVRRRSGAGIRAARSADRRPTPLGIVLAPTLRMRLKPSILVVDDCREVADILARHLRDQGYEVTLAHDGAAALALLARKPFDCILLDLMMPVMTGIEVLHELKRDPTQAAIPVILVSARVGEGHTHVIAERDADYSIGKPFTRRKVLDAV